MFITSDFHIHSEYSYDAKNTLEFLAKSTKEQGVTTFGITDHLNFNDTKFISDIKNSANAVNEFKKSNPNVLLGVELTPICKSEFDYISKRKSRVGYKYPKQTDLGIELGLSKQELIDLGVQYAIGASHWRLDVPIKSKWTTDINACINEWYRQQMFLACDERVTILGHPWWSAHNLWYEDFNVIPRSMKLDILNALKENGKYIECNSHFFMMPSQTEKFRNQYAEFLREAFEMGIPITYGSDEHASYDDYRPDVEKYLRPLGFQNGDINVIKNSDLWVK